MKWKLKIILILLPCVLAFAIIARIAYIKGIDALYENVEKEYAYLYETTTDSTNQVSTKNSNTSTQQPKDDEKSNDSIKVSRPVVEDKANTEKNSKNTSESDKSTAKPPKKTGVPKVPIPLPVPAKTLDSKAEAITGTKIETADYMAAGAIILKKLGLTQINQLFSLAKEDLFVNTSVEDLEKIRKDLFTNLSEGDLATLRVIGNKYGKAMYILDPDLNVKEWKAHMEKLKAKKEEKKNLN